MTLTEAKEIMESEFFARMNRIPNKIEQREIAERTAFLVGWSEAVKAAAEKKNKWGIKVPVKR